TLAATPTRRTVFLESMRFLITTFLITAAAGLTASAAQAAKGMEVTFQDDAIFVQNQGYYPRDAAYQRLQELGVRRLRFNVIWANYNPRQLDDAIATARAHGIRVQLTLTGPAPRGAAGSTANGRVSKPNARK